MNAIGKTWVYPRQDNQYKKKESLPYDEALTDVWLNRAGLETREGFMEWVAYSLVGIGVGVVAFIMEIGEEHLVHLTYELPAH